MRVEAKASIPQTANNGEDHVAVKARSIYPNLKLRVYTTGMRQNRLARLVGIDEAYLSRIINGVRVPGKQMQEQIAQVLGQANVRELGAKFNLSQESASSGLASLLPALIDHLTPKGQIDSETPLSGSLNALRGRFNV